MGFLFPGKEHFHTTECMAGVFVFCNPEYLAHPASGRWGMDGNDKNVGFTGNTWRNVNGRTIKEQLDFILEIDKEKNILRQTHLSDHGRRENDAEHAWHMAIMAYLLKEYSNEPIDAGKGDDHVPDP